MSHRRGDRRRSSLRPGAAAIALLRSLWSDAWANDEAYSFLLADQPTALRYVPDSQYLHNGAGAITQVIRQGVGNYRIDFNEGSNLGISLETLQVAAFGGGANYCNVGSFSNTVLCFDANGSPVAGGRSGQGRWSRTRRWL